MSEDWRAWGPDEIDTRTLVHGVRKSWPKARIFGGPNLGWRVGVPGDPPEFLTGRHYLTHYAWLEAWKLAGKQSSSR